MNSDSEQPLIIEAVQVPPLSPRGHPVWTLVDDTDTMVGWMPALPGELTNQPSCWEFETGRSIPIRFAAGYRRIPLT
jgi:hypothetical protein